MKERSELREVSSDLNVEDILSETVHHKGCMALILNRPGDALSCFQTFNTIILEEIGRNITKRKTSRLGISWNELGVAYMANQQWEKGEVCFLRALESVKEVENFSKTMMSFPLVNLGMAYWIQNRLDEATKVLTEGLKDREEIYGVDDRNSFM